MAGEAPAPPRRPATRPYSRLVSGVLLLILILLTIGVLVHGPLTGLDERIRAAVLARADSPAWRWLSDTPHRPAPLLTDLGMYTVAGPVLAVVAVALAIRRHTLRPLLIAVTGVVLLLGTVIPAKIIIGRPGPGLPAVLPGQLGVFPSGHTSTACVCFSLAVLMLVASAGPDPVPGSGRPGPALAGRRGCARLVRLPLVHRRGRGLGPVRAAHPAHLLDQPGRQAAGRPAAVTRRPEHSGASTSPSGGRRKVQPGIDAQAQTSRAAGAAGSPQCLLEAPHPAGEPLGSLLLRLGRLIAARPGVSG